MCERSVNSTGDLNPVSCSPLGMLIGETANAEAARGETRERIKRELGTALRVLH